MKKIIIVHGWTYSLEKWVPFVDLLKKEKIPFELPKIPGLTAPLHTPWTLDDYVQWLKKIIDKEKDKIILIGHSNGGRIAGTFSSQYPEKIAHLVLIDSAGIKNKNIFTRSKRTFFKLISHLGAHITTSEKARLILYKLIGEKDYLRTTPLMRRTMTNLISVDYSPYFAKITVPTFIIWGEKDKITPLSEGKQIHRIIPHSTLSIIKSAQHSSQYTHTEKVYHIIKKLL